MPYWAQIIGVFAAVNGLMCAAYVLGRRLVVSLYAQLMVLGIIRMAMPWAILAVAAIICTELIFGRLSE